MKPPWQVIVALVILVVSIAPIWFEHRPGTSDRVLIGTTVVMGVLLLGIALRMRIFRNVLLGLFVIGAAIAAWTFATVGTIEGRTLIVTGIQLAAMALLFTQRAETWFRRRDNDMRPDTRPA